ncbi:MAG: hypothetical protein K2L28_08160 [Muribaculaceae bacterium]|nr:hypothetical protein [Muribaculaceae bacterium]
MNIFRIIDKVALLAREFKASLRLREAIKMADKAHQQTGKRYYVMPQHGSGGKNLVVMDRFNFRRLKMKHYIHREARVFDLVRECFYCTGYRDGNQFLAPEDRKKKVMQYFAWVEADRIATNQRRKNGKV